MPISKDSLMQILRHASHARLERFERPLNAAMEQYGITTLRRAAAFIAQLAHESGEFRWMEEIWGPTAAQKRYEPQSDLATRLGNTEAGDGLRFKGRGPIQITGRSNYTRYGRLLDIDLAGHPEQAATPEVGFRIAGLFWQKNGLNELADRDDFKEITRRINGGFNGLEERKRFYALAQQVLAASMPAGAAPREMQDVPVPAFELPRGAEAIAESPAEREPRAPGASAERPRKPAKAHGPDRTFDARPDTMDFRDQMFVPTLIEVPTHIPLGNYLDHEVPILDQGKEGACTGYGLATVANYLLRRRRVVPDACVVSARMLYDLARRYDEWPGEDYSGSSARGAMKGWHKHGVCPETLYSSSPRGKRVLTEAHAMEARRRPLGAYFRVNHKDVVAMHSAIAEVGILYATCTVHEGWQQVGADGVIPLSDRYVGGHAFAIVAYDEEGFWLQNSWGPDWGRGGFARVSYDDWLRNGTDVWVARLGAPVMLRNAESTARAHASVAGESATYTFSALRPHIVAVGNDGHLRAGGDHGITPEGLRHIFEHDIPRMAESWKTVRVLLYAHGGLVDEASAVQRLAEYRPALLDGEVYPLAFVWRSDYWRTITNILEDAVRRRRPEGLLDSAKDFMLDRLDDALEPAARALTGRTAWKEMKENALAAGEKDRAASLVAGHLKHLQAQLAKREQPLEIHLVGHSAGSILHAGLIPRLVENGFDIATCTLWAPACTMGLFKERYLPALQGGQLRRFHLYVLGDDAERDDHCARIYNKSLLYLVSHALEDRFRIPGSPRHLGEPLLGMERWLRHRDHADILELFDGQRHRLVVAPNAEPPAGGAASQARHHGDFDDDLHTVLSTFAAITGAGGPRGAAAEAARLAAPKKAALEFHRSGSALRERRTAIDARTSGGGSR